MIAWARVASGWAANLDGSDARAVFSLPRLEVHPGATGWRSLCLRADGTRAERAGRPGDTVHQARAAAEAAWGRPVVASPIAPEPVAAVVAG